MSDNAESQTSQTKNESETSKPLFGFPSTSTTVRLFGHFKQNTGGFSGFGQSLSKEDSSPSSKSYFTSAVSSLSSTSGGGFGGSSTSLAASLAPLSANKELFVAATKTTDEQQAEKDENRQDGDSKEESEESSADENEDNDQSMPSLMEKAAEYQAKQASIHSSTTFHGDTSTGEEHETTSFKMTGKLYMFSPDQQQYIERGYGVLKINEKYDLSDDNNLQARLIMRLDKSFRVILNSPIFPKMAVERASDRSVRFGAQDESHLRIFVIKASTNDCAAFCRELQSRIQTIERQTPALSDSQSPNKTSENSSPSTVRIRKRSHSKSDSETTDNNGDASKKSKLNEGKNSDDESSSGSSKAGEQESKS